jgi:hypothetical protein
MAGGWGPYAPPGAYGPPPGVPPGHRPGSAPLVGGVPWEGDGNFIGRWWNTITAVNFRCREFFAAAAESSDAMTACMFSMLTAVLFTVVGLLLAGLVMLVFGAFLFSLFGSVGLGKLGPAFATLQIGFFLVGSVVALFSAAALGFLLPWVTGGIHHLVLLVLNGVGEGREYAHSVRVAAYAGASSQLWLMMPIPWLHVLVSVVFNGINHTTGYDEVHRCGGGKAFVAWLTPFLCCCCAGVLWAALGASFRIR